MIFPQLAELRLLNEEAFTTCKPKLNEVIRDVLLLRKGRITHLTTPAFHDNDMMDFLRKHVPHLEVCYSHFHCHMSLIFLQILPSVTLSD
jgi:hypothetical protein